MQAGVETVLQRTIPPRYSPVLSCAGRRNLAHKLGVSVSEITAEIRMAKLRVMENSCNKRPIIPVMNSRGMKTAISDKLMEMTVKPTCRAPLKRGLKGGAAFPH